MAAHAMEFGEASRKRRDVLALTGAVLTAGLAGCGGLTGDSEDSEDDGGSATDTDEQDGEDETSTEQSELESQLAAVREATAQYEDPEVALEDGFQVSGPYVPGMGWHFTHPERGEQAAEDGFDIEEPNLLTYLETDDGLELASVEYGIPADAAPDDLDLFADEEDENATEEWHTHEAATHVFALGNGEQTDLEEVSFDEWVTNDHWTEFHPPDKDIEAGDTAALNWGTPHGKEGETSERVADLVTHHPELKTLHAWVHVENPDGVFAPVHPDYGADGHDH